MADYDLITVGGGLAGSALAKVMADAGARVLVLEQERTFRLASVTKPIVAYAVLIAVEEGALDWDDPAGPEGSTVHRNRRPSALRRRLWRPAHILRAARRRP